MNLFNRRPPHAIKKLKGKELEALAPTYYRIAEQLNEAVAQFTSICTQAQPVLDIINQVDAQDHEFIQLEGLSLLDSKSHKQLLVLRGQLEVVLSISKPSPTLRA